MDIRSIALTVNNLEIAYGENVIQRNLDFKIHAGEIFIIMGESGSGKSSLLRHLTGLLRPVKGKIYYGDISFWDLTAEERSRFSCNFGISYQSGALWSSMTLAENIMLPLREHSNYSKKEIDEHASFKLSLVGLAGFEHYYPAEISGGMRKRAGLARALALDPDILFFDEPSAGLDPISAMRLDKLILELRNSLGTTVIVVTHDLDSIYAISDNAVFLDAEAKTQTAIGNPRLLRDSPPFPKIGEFLRRGRERGQLIAPN